MKIPEENFTALPNSASETRTVYFIVKNAAEVNRAINRKDRKICFLCTNTSVWDHCNYLGLVAVTLDEEVLKSSYREINRWAYETTLGLIRKHEANHRARLFLDGNFFDVKSIFSRVVKYIEVFERVLPFNEDKKFEVYMMDSAPSVFTLTIKFFLLSKGIQVGCEPSGILSKQRRKPVSISFKSIVYSLGALWASFWTRVRLKRGSVLVSGSLGHLGDLIKEIRNTYKKPMIYLENYFNLEKYLFCRKQGIDFFIVKTQEKISSPFSGARLAVNSGDIVWHHHDLTELFNQIFSDPAHLGFLNPVWDGTKILEYFKAWHVDRVILDEDVALRRPLFVAADMLKIPCAVLSHGVPTISILYPGEISSKGYYCSGSLLVQSIFERESWCNLFYDPKKIVLTGVPRYDRISAIKSPVVKKELRRGALKKILYCGTICVSYDFSSHSSITSLMGQRGFAEDYIKRSFLDLAELCSERGDAELIVKPHYENDSFFLDKLKDFSAKLRYRVMPHDCDIHALEIEADLIVTPASTVVCEALMLEKPVIILNYSKDDVADDYVDRGVAVAVDDRDAMRQALIDCLDSPEFLEKLTRARTAFSDYFCGILDGYNTKRAAAWIGAH